MKKKVKQIVCIGIVATMLIALLSTMGCGSINDTANADDYSLIESVKGVTFDIYGKLLDNSSFTSALADDLRIADGSTLVYRNDDTDYLLYNTSSFAVVCQRKTKLDVNNLSDSDLKSALASSTFLKTSITTLENKIKIKKGQNNGKVKLYVDEIECGVAPTLDSFQNYYGSLSYIEDDTYGYFLFCGSINSFDKMSKDERKMIEHTAKSLTYEGIEEETSDENGEAVTIDSSLSANDTENVSVSDNEEIKVEVNDTGNAKGVLEEVNAEISANEEKDKVEAPKPQTQEESVSENAEAEAKANEEAVEEEEVKEEVIEDNVDCLLSFTCLGYSKTPTGTDTKIYVYEISKDANEEVKKRVSDLEVKSGTHLESLTFSMKSLDKDYKDVDVSIRLKGLDKANLNYLGIEYSNKVLKYKDGSNYVCYYEIPNGCEEYLLEFGYLGNEVVGIEVKESNLEVAKGLE